MATIDYQPWYQGQTYPALSIPLLVGGVADDISSVPANKFSAVLRPTSGGNDIALTATIAITTTSPAVITLKFSAADVALSGAYNLFIKAMFPPSFTSVDEAIYDPVPFVITPS